MKIGVFDSGLGGLVITRSFIRELPQYDYFYYGDSAHLPYGDKTSGQILAYTLESLKYMIAQDCRLIIIACNTATSVCLRYIQQRFIPEYAPGVKVLGVVIPTVEIALADGAEKIGVVSTAATMRSHIYQTELHKINPELAVTEIAMPELVPAIENNDFFAASAIVRRAAMSLTDCDSLILGCTHYPLVKDFFAAELPQTKIVSQDELMGVKLRDYLRRHPEIAAELGTSGQRQFVVSRLNRHAERVAELLLPDICLQPRKI